MKTWILVANASQARLFQVGRMDGHLTELADFARSRTGALGAEDVHGDSDDAGAMAFAEGLAHILEHGRAGNEFDRLVLLAPAGFLGQLRDSLGEQVSRLVVESIDKDLADAKSQEIELILKS